LLFLLYFIFIFILTIIITRQCLSSSVGDTYVYHYKL